MNRENTTVSSLSDRQSVRAGLSRAEAPPWSFQFDEAAFLRPGAYLVAALTRRADDLGHKLVDMARELNVTYGYINQLRSGARQTKQISEEFTIACAAYLGVPRLTILVFSGQLTLRDLFDKVDVLEAEIPRAMSFLSDDPEWGLLVTPELRASSFDSQYCVIRLYEKATGRVLLPQALDPVEFGKAFQSLMSTRAQRLEALGITENEGTKEA